MKEHFNNLKVRIVKLHEEGNKFLLSSALPEKAPAAPSGGNGIFVFMLSQEDLISLGSMRRQGEVMKRPKISLKRNKPCMMALPNRVKAHPTKTTTIKVQAFAVRCLGLWRQRLSSMAVDRGGDGAEGCKPPSGQRCSNSNGASMIWYCSNSSGTGSGKVMTGSSPLM